MNRHSIVVWIATLSFLSNAGLSMGAWIRVGPVYRGGLELDIEGSTHAQLAGMDGVAPASKDSRVGDAGTVGDRDYDNGYVYTDEGTAVDGLTWYWGYDSASQYDPASDTLTFRSAESSIDRNVLKDAPISKSESSEGIGLSVASGVTWGRGESWEIDFCCGLIAILDMKSTGNFNPYREKYRETRSSVTDTYDLQGVDPGPAPYAGTYEGPGPLIPNTPEARSRTSSGSGVWDVEDHVSIAVDMQTYEFWTGLRLTGNCGDLFAVSLCPRVSATYVDVDAERYEVLTATCEDGSSEALNDWRDSASEGDWTANIGIDAEVTLKAGRTWFLTLAAGYNMALDEPSIDIGPNTIDVDTGGYDLAVLLGRSL